ncbi:tripartite motif-containing protein 16-like [Oryzias latipes]|uniref:Tripartite motif-containing protein 16-like n=1 Tax=Oryzias latipes TaxID=8090 RepID=H2LBP4_ORYLA|nr:tripartite motif-containing protein 16-like [Oryzias latipes]
MRYQRLSPVRCFRAEMAQRGLLLDQENLSCSICLDVLKEPVTVPCGHSYCMDCIKTHWDEDDQRGNHSCPQCRKTFFLRPVLEKNIMLAELVEELKKTELRSDLCYAGPEDVSCDVCSGRKMKAVKSCLDCLASYCEEHLQPHSVAPALQKHKLVDPSRNLQQNICSLHDEVMKIYCRTDQQNICYLCLMDEHKGHETVSAATERMEKQKKLQETRQQIQQKIQDCEQAVKKLQQEVEDINTAADKSVEDSEEIFSEMIRLLQNRSSEVKQQIRSQQDDEVNRVLDLQEKLEQEIRDLKSKDREMEQLSHTEDHSQCLHRYPSLSALSESTHSSSFHLSPLRYFEEVTAAVADTRDKLQELLRDSWTNITLTVDVLPPKPEPKTREDFLKYSRDVTLDPNTANVHLSLSEGNRKAEVMKQKLYYSRHPDRFTVCPQVLSRERLTGRCYWEVEWGGQALYVTVAYKDTPRSGDCLFGWNDRSWALYYGINVYQFCCNKVLTPLSGPSSTRVGVYLDHGAGVLAFYSVSETMTLLHRVQTTFTQPLHAGFRFFSAGDSAELIKLK